MAARSMSIYLLKEGRTVDGSLIEGHDYVEIARGTAPRGSRIFIRTGDQKPPWWQGHFGISANLTQQTNSAAVFVPIEDRVLVLTFGAGRTW